MHQIRKKNNPYAGNVVVDDLQDPHRSILLNKQASKQTNKQTNIVRQQTAKHSGMNHTPAICLIRIRNCFLLSCSLTDQATLNPILGRICTDTCTCCLLGIEAADSTCCLIQPQHTDARPTSHSNDPITLGALERSHPCVIDNDWAGQNGTQSPCLLLSRRTFSHKTTGAPCSREIQPFCTS